ncbi:MAG: decaprenyl-phosphate phosphoribosyltransferase [bacterium]|nr:decaprenyl-phosphate phosphoribosyltransferase [bacterium]
MTRLRAIIQLIRPAHWSKNLVLFAAVLFSPAKVVLANPQVLLAAFEAFLAFCLVSGAVYAFNDVLDLAADRHHPKKRNRPLPAGRISVAGAVMVAAAFAAVGLLWAFLLSTRFGVIVTAYLVTNIVYSAGLKRMVILDVLLLSAGFVYRAIGGVAIVEKFLENIYLSYWLILCAFLLSLFLALAKRRREIALLGDAAAAHRASLADYSLQLIDQVLAALTAATLVSYSLYTISDDTLAHYGTRALFWTIPFVVYGLFRYLYLIYNRSEGGDPAGLLLRDRPTLINVALWVMVTAVIVYFR